SALGAGVAIAGASDRRRHDEIAASLRAAGYPADVAALQRLEVEGARMVAAGATLSVLGVVAGVPLLVLGARDLRLGRRAQELARGGRPGARGASIRVEPAIGGIRVGGRF
ncbi:MAG TPA: hypothetical protein VIK91_14150, partial [Nannocystis sp.]